MVSAFVCTLFLPLRAGVITEWNDLVLDSIRSEATPPPLVARNLAMVPAAIYAAATAWSPCDLNLLIGQTSADARCQGRSLSSLRGNARTQQQQLTNRTL